ISEAALGSEDLDTFLPRLLRVMLETTESVDSVTLLLREGDELRVRASVGLEALVASGFSVRVGEGFSGKIAAERNPVELRSAATDPLVRSEALRALGIRALYGVPLVQGDEVIGVAHMGSRTAYEFSNEDKLLFRAMVSRVTGLIMQAWLAARERTAREKAEESLALVDVLLATAPVGLCFQDQELRYVRINHTLAATNGVSMEETLGRTPYEVIPELAPAVEGYLRHVLDTGEPVLNVEVTGSTRAQGGARGHWLVSYYPVWDAAGRISLVGSVVVDITDRKRAEEALAQVEALVEAAPAGLALLDSELRYVHINEALAASNGPPVEAHLGRRVAEVIPENARIVEPMLRRVLETGEAFRGQEFSNAPASDPGVPHHWVGDYFPVRARDGRVVGVGGVIMDITERKQQEEQLRQTAEFRERFLGVVSHDLRNPLNAILLSANALLRAEGIPASHTKMVRRITTSAERMVRMIGELLDFTRGRLGGGIPIHPKPTHLRHLCRHVLEELEISHPGRELRLEADGGFQGEWDPDRLTQLLGNLGKNALDYSPAGTPVDFTLHDEDDGVRLEVHNEGSPIPSGMLPGIFEPFRRGVEGDAHPTSGLGLGLFIVQQIAEAHGGTVEVRSHAGAGTTFTVRLPRRASGAPEALPPVH
ncbi:PAS domain-containing protein, partial [Archangium sp.]|uniref:PAS domain-containing protein n=1 Tax=Archangium sp. TaxID=1872627 RepID=UPI00389A790A